MKLILFVISVVCIFVMATSVPVSVGFGLYDWAVVDVQFKVAAWDAFKLWLKMMCVGLIGITAHFLSIFMNEGSKQ